MSEDIENIERKNHSAGVSKMVPMTTPPPIHPLAKEAAEHQKESLIINNLDMNNHNSSTTHPLALKAGKAIFEAHSECVVGQDEEWASIIQTTALDPVLKAGEELEKALDQLYEAADVFAADQDRAADDRCGLVQPVTVAECNKLNQALQQVVAALTQWRTLTSPKTGDSTPLAGSRSDFEGQKDHPEVEDGA